MNLFLAINRHTGEVKAFVGGYALESFGIKHEYEYEYYRIGEAKKLDAIEVGFNDKSELTEIELDQAERRRDRALYE